MSRRSQRLAPARAPRAPHALALSRTMPVSIATHASTALRASTAEPAPAAEPASAPQPAPAAELASATQLARSLRCALAALLATTGLAAASTSGAAEWERDWLVPGGPFRGIHGLAVGADGWIYAGSVMSQATYRVDPMSGRVETVVAAPDGEADDLELAGDGTLYFTGFMHGTLTERRPDGTLRVLARDLPGMNSLALDARGRLFATQVFVGDALWEIDRTGQAEPRLVRKDLGGLNGFDFGPDGRLCGPLWFRAQVVCLDVDGDGLEVVADGFHTPAAANFDPSGELFAIDNVTGEVFRIDRAKRRKQRIATAPTNLDNLAFAPDGRLFVSNMSDNAIYEVDRASGAIRTVVASPLTHPGGIARAGGTLYVADMFSLSEVELASGEVRDIHRDAEASGSPTLIAANDAWLATASFHRDSATLWDRATKRVVARWSRLGQPSAIALGPGSRVVVATVDGRLIELDPQQSDASPDAKPEARRVLARGLGMPMGVVRTEQGWIVSEARAGRLVALSDEGKQRTLARDLAHPEGIALLPDGRIAVAETAADRVTLVDPTTGAKQTIATDLPLGLADLPTMPAGLFPTGLASADDGSLLLSSDVEGGILRLRAPAAVR